VKPCKFCKLTFSFLSSNSILRVLCYKELWSFSPSSSSFFLLLLLLLFPLLLFLLLKRYSPLWTWLPIQSPSVPSGLWSLYDNLLFPLPSNPLHSNKPIFSVVCPFSIFLRFWQSFFFLLGILSLLILSVCPYHLNLSDWTNFAVSAPVENPHISLFVLILQLLLLWNHKFFLQFFFPRGYCWV